MCMGASQVYRQLCHTPAAGAASGTDCQPCDAPKAVCMPTWQHHVQVTLTTTPTKVPGSNPAHPTAGALQIKPNNAKTQTPKLAAASR